MLSWLRRTAAALWPFGEHLRAPDALAGLPRVLLLGPTGAGKSTLVNAVLGIDSAEARSGAPVTVRTTWHAGPAWPAALGDTRGLETAAGQAQAVVLRQALAALGPGERPDLAWLVLNAETGRAHAGAGTLAALAEALRAEGIPALVVLTHAEPGEDAHAGLRARIAGVLGPLPVVRVNARETRGEDGAVLVPEHGVDVLRAASDALLPAR
ncbi:GTPase domain-containing protein [Roseomonas sp. CCTCC AB2023176]|uniref:GTPase domain-containing protein n=1 Tax=Roseomonas sp. CCTCC AB2023176 TaxID=3342640 RepID=UPI0035D7F52E